MLSSTVEHVEIKDILFITKLTVLWRILDTGCWSCRSHHSGELVALYLHRMSQGSLSDRLYQKWHYCQNTLYMGNFLLFNNGCSLVCASLGKMCVTILFIYNYTVCTVSQGCPSWRCIEGMTKQDELQAHSLPWFMNMAHPEIASISDLHKRSRCLPSYCKKDQVRRMNKGYLGHVCDVHENDSSVIQLNPCLSTHVQFY